MNLRGIIPFAATTLGLLTALATPQAPPPAVSGERPASEVDALPRSVRPLAETSYDIGDPSDEEQMYLELVNYARADPEGEALRFAQTTDPTIRYSYEYFAVDLELFISDTRQYPPAPPLAFEPRLIQAARGHSQWMLDRGIQSHDQSNPTVTTAQRITASGYPWQRYAESIYAYAQGPEHGHAGFEVDWGLGPGGMQDPPGHRNNNHDPSYREVGIGVIRGHGLNGTGPSAVTLNFAARVTQPPLVTGVAYYDVNGNHRYDLGEGVGGITVTVSDSAWFAVTTASGGYAIPTANGARVITFSGNGLSPVTVSQTVGDGRNLKVDLALPYSPPTLSGPAHVPVGQTGTYTFAPVAGAVAYRGRVVTAREARVFDASDGLAGMSTSLVGTPEPVITRPNGNSAYHLTHGEGISEEILTLEPVLRPRAGATVQFLRRLGYASADQIARLEASLDQGSTWTPLWSQVGAGAPGETEYTLQSVSLSSFAGQTLRLRFSYGFGGCANCQFYPQTGEGAGFHFDSVEFIQVEELTEAGLFDFPVGSPLTFSPPGEGTFELSVQPLKQRGTLPFGPARVMDTLAVAEPTLTLSRLAVDPSGVIQVDFTVSGVLTGVPTLLRAPTLGGVYADSGATLHTQSPGSYRFEYEPAAELGFLRVHLP